MEPRSIQVPSAATNERRPGSFQAGVRESEIKLPARDRSAAVSCSAEAAATAERRCLSGKERAVFVTDQIKTSKRIPTPPTTALPINPLCGDSEKPISQRGASNLK